MPRKLKDCESPEAERAYVSAGRLMEDDWKDMQDVDLEPAPRKGAVVSIRFDDDTTRQLRRLAKRMGIGYTTLVRIWIMERLESELRPDLKVRAGGRGRS